ARARALVHSRRPAPTQAHPAAGAPATPGPSPTGGDDDAAGPRAGARAPPAAPQRCPAEFTELAELPSLPAFLGYLRDAEDRERGLEPGEIAVNPEAVQLLTGHSAKGLEGDVVAVPR